MIVGVCSIKLRLPENHSLKGKRQVVKPIVERVKNKFNVSIAEVNENDRWQVAELGIVCVSNDAHHADEVLSKVVNFIQDLRLDAEILEYHIEVIPVS